MVITYVYLDINAYLSPSSVHSYTLPICVCGRQDDISNKCHDQQTDALHTILTAITVKSNVAVKKL